MADMGDAADEAPEVIVVPDHGEDEMSDLAEEEEEEEEDGGHEVIDLTVSDSEEGGGDASFDDPFAAAYDTSSDSRDDRYEGDRVPLLGLLKSTKIHEAHFPMGEHPENPSRIPAMWQGVTEALQGLIEGEDFVTLDTEGLVAAKEMTALVKSVHSDLASREKAFRVLGEGDTYIRPGTRAAAFAAAMTAVSAVEAVVKETCVHSMAVIRPPGHHAGADKRPVTHGFCFLNNAALAAAHARKVGVESVFVVDFDVHHGDGTQAILYGGNVPYFSIHKATKGFFPGGKWSSSHLSKAGTNINVPFPFAKATAGDYMAVLHLLLLPALQDARPSLVILSAGFDAMPGDIGGYSFTAEAIQAFVSAMQDTVPQASFVVLTEGGYVLKNLTEGCRAVVKAITQGDDDVEEFKWEMNSRGAQAAAKTGAVMVGRFPERWPSVAASMRRREGALASKVSSAPEGSSDYSSDGD